MKTKVGLWIDHRKAIVVAVTDKGEETRLIISKVERQLRRSGDSPLEGTYDRAQVPARNSRQRTFTSHLNIYYDAVIACIRDAIPDHAGATTGVRGGQAAARRAVAECYAVSERGRCGIRSCGQLMITPNPAPHN